MLNHDSTIERAPDSEVSGRSSGALRRAGLGGASDTRGQLRLTKIVTVCAVLLVCVAVLSVGGRARAAKGRAARAYTPSIPKGIPHGIWQKMIPADNPLTAEKVALGRALYFDRRLSADGTVSCAICHDPATAFADQNPLAVGVDGRKGTRNSPTVLNAMFNRELFWDGRARSLEEQVEEPLLNPSEMGMQTREAVVARVSSIPEYRQAFPKAFGEQGLNIKTIAKAIAAFERTQLSGNSPFDRYMAGDENAISEAQKRGWKLFQGKARCIVCHTFNASTPFFTDFQFHNTGVATRNKNFEELSRRALVRGSSNLESVRLLNTRSHAAGITELGRYLVTGHPKDTGAFKTPTLRDVELTTPYMHDGSEKTLLDIVKYYNRGGEKHATLDRQMRPLSLTDEEMNELVEFMRTLTSDDVLRQAQRAQPQTRLPNPLP